MTWALVLTGQRYVTLVAHSIMFDMAGASKRSKNLSEEENKKREEPSKGLDEGKT